VATQQVEAAFGTIEGAETSAAALGSTSTRPAGAGIETFSVGNRSDLDPTLYIQL